MVGFTAAEATLFFRSYGLKCKEKLVQEWMDDKNTKITNNPVCEKDFHCFYEWYRWKETAYEEEIDDRTEMEKLLEEIDELKSEIKLLEMENEELKWHLEDLPFPT